MSIEVTQLTKQYGEQKAVNNISFSLRKGEIVGFLGPNGAGKSTTMKMITGYLLPDKGNITIAGVDVQQQPLQAKRKIGYLPESNALYYDMYVKEYLSFVAGIHQIQGVAKRIADIIELTGLQVEQRKKIGQLSKGYKQRVGLAAALIHDPEVLILDEPTSGLDPNQIIEIRNVIQQQGQHKTVLFSSHILQEVEAICSRAIIIHKGIIVADAPLATLQKGTAEKHLLTIQFEAVPGEVLNLLRQTEGIENISVIPMQGSAVMLQVHTSQPEQVRKQVLALSLQHNLNIVSLQSEVQKLEDVFRSLTVKA